MMWVDVFIQWLIPFVCGCIVSLVCSALASIRARKSEDKAIHDGLQCLLRAEIISQHDKWKEKEFCPIYAKEALKRAYSSYHNLGGNDVATDLYVETMQLATEKEAAK